MKTPTRYARVCVTALATLMLAFGAVAAEKKQAKTNDFPNATRKEPAKLELSESQHKKINAAYDALDEGDDAKAEQLLTEAKGAKRASKYEQALALQGLSQVAYNKDEVGTAVELNKQAIALDALDNNSQFNLMYQVAQMSIMDERYEEALTAIDDYFKVSGATNKADAWSLKGNALYRLERFPEAGEAMKKAISLSPKPNDSWNQMLVAIYYESDNFPEAAKAAEEILAKNPNDKGVRQQLSAIYLEMEQNDKAIALLENAYKQGQLSEEKDLKQLYQLYNYVEKPAEAARVINEGLQKGVLKPSAETYKGLGDAYAINAESIEDSGDSISAARKEALKKATDAYGEAVKLGADADVEMTRGHLLVEAEDWGNAKAALSSAIAKGKLKREGSAYILLGTAEYELGNQKAAEAAYTKALAFPDSKSMAESWLKSIRQR